MKSLVKIYDTEQVNNLISILAFCPKKAIFLYDSKNGLGDLDFLEKTCVSKISNINFEFISINMQDLEDVRQKCKKIIQRNKECFFDITGSKELGAIGMYLACVDNFTPVFKLDISHGRFINVYGCSLISENFHMPSLDLETILMSRGALIKESLHPTPNLPEFEKLLPFCSEVFKNTGAWKILCSYIQAGNKSSVNTDNALSFNCETAIDSFNPEYAADCIDLLKNAEKLGLIKEFTSNETQTKFIFAGENIKRYMADFGSWLEIYTYITLLRSKLFKDVKMSVRIGWGGVKKEKISDVINEVDVVFFSGIHPVFVSCKLSCPTTESLQELSVYPSYFGGKHSKCIMVTASNVKLEKPKILQRASEMNIDIIDISVIKQGKLIECIATKILKRL